MNIATSSRQLSVKKFSLALLPLSVLLSMQSMAAAAVSTAESTNQTATEPTTDLGALSAQTDSYHTTATKTALDPDDAPMSYSRIEQQTLKERQADSVSSALRYEPEVSTEAVAQ